MKATLFKMKKEFKKEKSLEVVVILLFVAIGVLFRFLPHPPNFTPVGAIALFAGAYLSRPSALILPLAVMAVSDIFIGFYEPALMVSVYASFIISALIGSYLKKNPRWFRVGKAAFLSSLIFFTATNFTVWAFTPWYPKNISGLLSCYLLALPFFKNSLLSHFFYSAVLFASYEAVGMLALNFLKKKVFGNASRVY